MKVEVVKPKEPCLLDLTDDMYQGSLNSEIVDKFVCMICYGMVMKPLKCTKCENIVCYRCVSEEKLLKG